MEIADAFGPGQFAIPGTSVAMADVMSASVSILLGATTAIAGGVARDVLCNEVPKVYREHRPYALCALAGDLSFIGFTALDVASELGSLVGIGVATRFRLPSPSIGSFPAGVCHRNESAGGDCSSV
ncbi:trimeric intracellular cation channel family protein, partial [Hydrogenophaga sp.]|uniref:trimeric intracellular cation channel family protein n=2 Tax=Hydrogenophaga sp. TaxID=1904254 RepID=UPI002734F27D